MSELELIDLSHTLIESFVASYFRWPVNLKTLLLQGNSFHFLPPLPRCPYLVDFSDNMIDCSCQRAGHKEVNRSVVLKLTVACNEMWSKMHWKNPFCTFPTVHVAFKAFEHEEQVIATSVQNTQVIFGLTKYNYFHCLETRKQISILL